MGPGEEGSPRAESAAAERAPPVRGHRWTQDRLERPLHPTVTWEAKCWSCIFYKEPLQHGSQG